MFNKILGYSLATVLIAAGVLVANEHLNTEKFGDCMTCECGQKGTMIETVSIGGGEWETKAVCETCKAEWSCVGCETNNSSRWKRR